MADTLLLTVPNQLGVEYNAHVIEAILKPMVKGTLPSMMNSFAEVAKKL